MRLAVIGLGFMGGVHVNAIRSLPDVTLAAVVSRSPAKFVAGNLGAAAPVDLSGVRVYREIEAALADPQIDAVDLCLPTDLHEPVAIEALRCGKHVLVEKPMALTAAACDRMIKQARKSQRVLMIAHVLRFFPAYRALEAALPRIGTPRTATFRRRCSRPDWGEWQSDPARSGGAILDLLIHDVDMALHLFGTPASVRATGVDDPARGLDIVSARLSFSSGCSVEISGGWYPGKLPFSMECAIAGDCATLDYHSESRPPALYHDRGAEPLPLETTDGYAAEIAGFARCVRGEEPTRCPVTASAAALRLALLIRESRAHDGETIRCKSES